jgi:hemimethylated DNA binding protein
MPSYQHQKEIKFIASEALTAITICSRDTVPFIVLRLGYRGVIIGWDEVARAPEQWLKLMHKENAYVTTHYYIPLIFSTVSSYGYWYLPGFRIRIDLMQIRIQHFSNCGS